MSGVWVKKAQESISSIVVRFMMVGGQCSDLYLFLIFYITLMELGKRTGRPLIMELKGLNEGID